MFRILELSASMSLPRRNMNTPREARTRPVINSQMCQVGRRSVRAASMAVGLYSGSACAREALRAVVMAGAAFPCSLRLRIFVVCSAGAGAPGTVMLRLSAFF